MWFEHQSLPDLNIEGAPFDVMIKVSDAHEDTITIKIGSGIRANSTEHTNTLMSQNIVLVLSYQPAFELYQLDLVVQLYKLTATQNFYSNGFAI